MLKSAWLEVYLSPGILRKIDGHFSLQSFRGCGLSQSEREVRHGYESGSGQNGIEGERPVFMVKVADRTQVTDVLAGVPYDWQQLGFQTFGREEAAIDSARKPWLRCPTPGG